MDNTGPTSNAHLRKQALEKAIQLHSLWLRQGEINCTAEQQLQDIVHVANTFYAFLEGETK